MRIRNIKIKENIDLSFDNEFAENYFKVFSATVVPFESFFIRSLASFNAKEDSTLSEFILQELNHSKMHNDLNKRIFNSHADNYFFKLFTFEIGRYISKIDFENKGKLEIISVVGAFEYFTLITSVFFVLNNYGKRHLNKDLYELMRYHSLEEIEHRHVCEELYLKNGGGIVRYIISVLKYSTLSLIYILYQTHKIMSAKKIKPYVFWINLFKFLIVDGKFVFLFAKLLIKRMSPFYRIKNDSFYNELIDIKN